MCSRSRCRAWMMTARPVSSQRSTPMRIWCRNSRNRNHSATICSSRFSPRKCRSRSLAATRLVRRSGCWHRGLCSPWRITRGCFRGWLITRIIPSILRSPSGWICPGLSNRCRPERRIPNPSRIYWQPSRGETPTSGTAKVSTSLRTFCWLCNLPMRNLFGYCPKLLRQSFRWTTIPTWWV